MRPRRRCRRVPPRFSTARRPARTGPSPLLSSRRLLVVLSPYVFVMTDASGRLPDFFLLGAAKCGTTSLHDYLRQHPDLFLPYVKELNFFDANDEQFTSGQDRYRAYFAEAGHRQAGEATPSYFRRTDVVPSRMRRVYVEQPPRFLLLLRDPVNRAYSHYLHNVSEGREPLAFRDALQAEKARPVSRGEAWKGYFADGVYADSLITWFDAFSRERFLIVLSRDLAADPAHTLRQIFRFLGVDPEAEIETGKRLNQTGERQSRRIGRLLAFAPNGLLETARGWMPESIRLGLEQLIRRRSTGGAADRPSLDPALERQLRQRYEPHVERLAAMIDRDLAAWRPHPRDADATLTHPSTRS